MFHLVLQESHLLVHFDLKLSEKVLHKMATVSYCRIDIGKSTYVIHLDMLSIEECMTRWRSSRCGIQSFRVCCYLVKNGLSIGIIVLKDRVEIRLGSFWILFKICCNEGVERRADGMPINSRCLLIRWLMQLSKLNRFQ